VYTFNSVTIILPNLKWWYNLREKCSWNLQLKKIYFETNICTKTDNNNKNKL